MSYEKSRPGIAFKNGKLYVFSKCRVSVLKGWPEMAAWTRSKGQPLWCRFRPLLDIAANTAGDVRSRHRFHPALPVPPRTNRLPPPQLQLADATHRRPGDRPAHSAPDFQAAESEVRHLRLAEGTSGRSRAELQTVSGRSEEAT